MNTTIPTPFGTLNLEAKDLNCFIAKSMPGQVHTFQKHKFTIEAKILPDKMPTTQPFPENIVIHPKLFMDSFTPSQHSQIAKVLQRAWQKYWSNANNRIPIVAKLKRAQKTDEHAFLRKHIEDECNKLMATIENLRNTWLDALDKSQK